MTAKKPQNMEDAIAQFLARDKIASFSRTVDLYGFEFIEGEAIALKSLFKNNISKSKSLRGFKDWLMSTYTGTFYTGIQNDTSNPLNVTSIDLMVPFDSIPDELTEFKLLNRVKFSSRQSTSPKNISYLNNVDILDFSGSKIMSFENDFADLKVKELNLSKIGLDLLPEFIYHLKNLENLDVSHNEISSLLSREPQSLNLKSLNFSNNNLKYIAKLIYLQSNLESLNLAKNPLENLNVGKYYAPNVKHLNISGCRLGKNFRLDDLPRSLVTLKAKSNNITHLSSVLGEFTNLEEIDFSYNQFEEIPSSIGKLKKLKVALLSDGWITSIPNSFGNLSSLVHADLSDNQITGIPVSLIGLTAMKGLKGDYSTQGLNLDRNNIESIPKNVYSNVPIFCDTVKQKRGFFR